METRDITAEFLDGNNTGINDTQYASKPIDPKELKLVINETIIQQTVRTPLQIKRWRDAHKQADSRYYPDRTWLYDLYDDCRLDGHVSGIIDKRFDTVVNKPLQFKKGGKVDDSFNDLILSAQFRMVCRAFLEALEWGISGIEFEPGKEFAPRLIPRKHIKPKWQVISFEQSGITGVDYTTASNIMIVGEPECLGFMLKCVPYIIYKRNVVADWAKYIEVFGQPIRVMFYEATDQQAKIELKQTLDNSAGSLAIMIPKGVEFDIKDGKESNGDGKLQKTFTDTMNQDMSVIVLGNTETTTNGQTGSQAKSKVHKEQQDEISKSDLFYLSSWLNCPQFLLILKSYGYDVEGGRFEHTREISIEYLAQRIAIDVQLPEDLPIPDDYWYETYGIEKPANYNELKKKLEDRQKMLQAANEIKSDPENKPAKAPAKTPSKKELKKLIAQYNRSIGGNQTAIEPLDDNTWKQLFRKVISFFDQARRGK